MQKPSETNDPARPPGPARYANPVNPAPDFELPQRTIAEVDEAAREPQRTYRDVLASFETAGDDNADGEATEADLRSALVALCFHVVRHQAEPDKRLYRFLLCENDGDGKRLVLDASLDEAALRRELDRIIADRPTRSLYLVREEYVRVAATVRMDPKRTL